VWRPLCKPSSSSNAVTVGTRENVFRPAVNGVGGV
jgi:hypothetical protein